MQPSSLQDIEQFLMNTIFPDLDRGRPQFDMPHTRAVVYHLKNILKHTKHVEVDSLVLIIAAYAHDWGYSGLFTPGKSVQYEEVQQAKKLHMKLGAEKLQNLLNNEVFKELTTEQKQRAVHLVAVHDDIKNLHDSDELILMEADTLGALDISFVQPTFDHDSNQKFIEGVYRKRLPQFFTEFGKKEATRLIKEREKYYQRFLSDLHF